MVSLQVQPHVQSKTTENLLEMLKAAQKYLNYEGLHNIALQRLPEEEE